MEIPKSWRLRQENGYTAKLRTKASNYRSKAKATLNTGLGGQATGDYGAAAMSFRIYWDNGSIGQYELEAVDNGVLGGRSCDEAGNCVGIRSLTTFDFVGCD